MNDKSSATERLVPRMAAIASLVIPCLLVAAMPPGRNPGALGICLIVGWIATTIGGLVLRLWATLEIDSDSELEPGRTAMGFFANMLPVFALGDGWRGWPWFVPSLGFALSFLLHKTKESPSDDAPTPRAWRGTRVAGALLLGAALLLLAGRDVPFPRPFFLTLGATVALAGAFAIQAISRLRSKVGDQISLTGFRGLANTIATAGYLAVIGAPLLDGKGWIVPWLAAVPAFLSWNVLRGRTCIVGPDAVVLRGVFSTRVYPLDQVEGVERGKFEPESSLRLKSGKLVRLPRLMTPSSDEDIEKALAVAKTTPLFEDIARNGRSVGAWREALAKRSRGGEEYRSAELDPERLHEVLERPAAAPEQKIGAALALRGVDDPAARQKIRIAASASANPAVAEVLEQLADGDVDDRDIEAALRSRR